MKFHVYIILLLSLVCACSGKKHKPSAREVSEIRARMVNVNRIIVGTDADSIRTLVESKKWGLTQTSSGLWHRIYHVGKGDSARSGKVVSLSFRLRLLDGKLLYTSDSLGLKTFILGRGGVESGLDEGLRLLREGDSARFVMPPHLAHGLVGDQKRIPRMAIIVYDVVLQGVESNE